MDMTNMNVKIGWIIGGVVVALGLIAFAVYDSQKPVLPPVAETASSTDATSTMPDAMPASHAAAPAPAAPISTTTVVNADGTIVFTAPTPVTVAIGKTAVERASGLRITVKSIASKKKLPVSTNPTPTVLTMTLNTGSCTNGTCTSREDTAQNVSLSNEQSIVFGGYTVAVSDLTLTDATFAVSKAL